jgi:hypothetical protein
MKRSSPDLLIAFSSQPIYQGMLAQSYVAALPQRN